MDGFTCATGGVGGVDRGVQGRGWIKEGGDALAQKQPCWKPAPDVSPV